MRFLYLLLLIMMMAGPTAMAQSAPPPPSPPATGSLSGMVLDSLSGKPVAYATVVLLPLADEKPITGVAADDAGKFNLSKLAAGRFRLRVSFVGYGAQTRAVAVTDGPGAVPAFRLPAAATALAEAVVLGSKPVVDVRPDRLIYNADQDVTNAGGTAADVLRKAPLLSVDGEGNVKMRGSGNFRVLVNNKPSPTMVQNLAEALKSIPADNIQSIEIITTPPAKYDGEGTAGIINIVLKKGVNQNVNGRVGAASGNRNSNLDASLNFRKAKVGFTSAASVGLWYNPGEFLRQRTTYDGTGKAVDFLDQTTDIQNNGGWYYGTLGLDYDPADHHSLSLAGSVNGWGGTTDLHLGSQTVSYGAGGSSQFARDNLSRFTGVSGELTGSYTRTFALARREWSVLAQYANNSSTSGYDFEQYNNRLTPLDPGRASYRERSRGRAPGHEITAQTDFTQPFGDSKTLEMGLKSIWRRTGSFATVDGFNPATQPDFVPQPLRRTDFSYDQNVQATYATYSFKAGKKLGFSLGSRLERTTLAAEFRTTETGFARAYLTPLPNGSAQYSFSDATSLRLAYSRRITRPYIEFLNPFVDRSDPNTITFGNPGLDPELTDSYELGYNTSIKTASINATASVRYTGNAIESVRRASATEPGVVEATFANVAANAFYQLNIYGSVKPTAKWDLSGGPEVQYIVRRSPALGVVRRGFTAGLNLNTSYKLPKNWTLQGFVYASLPSPDIQGRGAANLYYQLGAKKTFYKDRFDAVLNFATPFNRFWPYRSTTTTPLFDEVGEYRAYQQGFRFSLGYRFGQDKGGRQRKSISNDDKKGGGSKQGGQ